MPGASPKGDFASATLRDRIIFNRRTSRYRQQKSLIIDNRSLSMNPVQYITNEQGKQVGVLLDIKTYQQLTTSPQLDSDCLVNLSHPELEALAESTLAPEQQQKLSELLVKNKASQLSAEESKRLDHLLQQVDSLTLLKTRAKYTLNCLEKLGIPG